MRGLAGLRLTPPGVQARQLAGAMRMSTASMTSRNSRIDRGDAASDHDLE